MKQFKLSLVIFAFFTLSLSAFADSAIHGTAAQSIYEALTIGVDTEDLSAGALGKSRTQREVGGVSCVRSAVVYPGAEPSFECQFADELNSEATFRALNVESVMTTRIGSHAVTKTVGPLVCTKSKPVVWHPKATYSCVLSAE